MADGATTILMLHRVKRDEPTSFGLPSCYRIRGTALTPAEFDSLLDRLACVVSLGSVVDALSAGRLLPVGSVLTFDDGYREHLDWVVPRLRERGLTGVFYVSTGLGPHTGHVGVVDAWYAVLDRAVGRVARVAGHKGRVDTMDGKRRWVEGAPKAALLASDPERQWALVAQLAESLGVDLDLEALARDLYLGPSEWELLREQGMELGAHGLSHTRLTTVSTTALNREVSESVARLGSVPFAYPDGDFDDAVVACVRALGATSGVTCLPGDVEPGADRFRLARRFVTPRSLALARPRG